jgi:predicted RNA-binding protein
MKLNKFLFFGFDNYFLSTKDCGIYRTKDNQKVIGKKSKKGTYFYLYQDGIKHKIYLSEIISTIYKIQLECSQVRNESELGIN